MKWSQAPSRTRGGGKRSPRRFHASTLYTQTVLRPVEFRREVLQVRVHRCFADRSSGRKIPSAVVSWYSVASGLRLVCHPVPAPRSCRCPREVNTDPALNGTPMASFTRNVVGSADIRSPAPAAGELRASVNVRYSPAQVMCQTPRRSGPLVLGREAVGRATDGARYRRCLSGDNATEPAVRNPRRVRSAARTRRVKHSLHFS